MTKRRDAYYEKYFPNGTGEGEWSEYHELNIHLKKGVTRSDLLKAGLVEGKEEVAEVDHDSCDFWVCEENEEWIFIPSLMVPINGDAGVEQEDLPEGIELLPEDWEDSVPELIGLKSEWVEWVSMDG